MRSTLLLLISLAAFTCSAAPTQPASTPYRTSVTGAGNSHSPVFSVDGRHIAFVSHANNLVTNDDLAPHLDLFVRNLVTSNTVLVSKSTNGFGGANDNIGLYSLSSNAQVVAFDTAASNLLPWDNNRVSDIYVRDLQFGGMMRVTWGLDDDANGPSFNPLISEDGRYVIFESLASNLVTNDFNGTNDIFIHDLTTGITELVSVNAEGTASPNGPSHSPSISADGLTVAFVSHATNLVEGVTNKSGEIYARNVTDGVTQWAMASHLNSTRVYSASSGMWGPYVASTPLLSENGRHVAFKTLGRTVRFDLHRPTNTFSSFVTNQAQSGVEIVGTYFDDNPRLAGSPGEWPIALAPDGAHLFFVGQTNVSPATGLFQVDFETLMTNDVYVTQDGGGIRIVHPGATFYITNIVPRQIVAVTNVSSTYRPTWTQMNWLGVNADGSRIFFLADATNLVANVTNRTSQLYSFDIASGALSLISTNRDGNVGPDIDGVQPSATRDGSLVAWDTPDDNLVFDDLNRAWDVFVRNVDTGETRLISERHSSLPANTALALSRIDLGTGALSADGNRIAVLSLDGIITADDTNIWRDLFSFGTLSGSRINVSRSPARLLVPGEPFTPGNNALAPFLSTDGAFLAFVGVVSELSTFTGFSGGTNRVLYWRDLQALTNRTITSGVSLSLPVLSASGRFVAFHSADPLAPAIDGNNLSDIYIFDASDTSATKLIAASTANANGAIGNGISANPVFSPDGNWIVFQSAASNLVTGPATPAGRYQLYARRLLPDQTNLLFGAAHLVSYTTSASPNPSGDSIQYPLPGGAANPRFSANSRYVAFEAGTNSIYRHDLLGGWVTNLTPHPEGPVTFYLTNRARFTNDLVCANCRNPALSGDGRFVAYQTSPTSGPITNILVKDILSGQEELISVSLTGGTGGNAASFNPLLSHDARYIVFVSKASDLVANDANQASDIFVRDRLAGVTHCLSQNWLGTGTGNRVSSNPILAANGRTVAFQSFASDLVPGDYNDTRDVFILTLGGADADGDGMDDDWEMAYFSTVSRDGTGDFDNDGASDLDEFRAGTNPANDASILRVLTLTTAPDTGGSGQRTTVLIWSAVPGRTYRVQFKSDIEASWEELGNAVLASGTTASQSHRTDDNNSRGFYRVLLVQ